MRKLYQFRNSQHNPPFDRIHHIYFPDTNCYTPKLPNGNEMTGYA